MSNPTIQVVTTGPTDVVEVFTGPRGLRGATGANGTTGAAGPAQTDASSLATGTVADARLPMTIARARTIDVKSHGVVGGGVSGTANDAAFTAILASAVAGDIIEFPSDDYLITAGLVFPEGVVPHMTGSARLIYNGTGTALTFYRWANNTPRNQGNIRVAVYKTTPAWWGADTTSIGVLFDTCYHMTVEIGRAQGFHTGVSLLGNGAVGYGGTSYIDIKLGTLDQNKIGLDSSVLTTGYVSAINLFGGTIRLDSIGQSTNAGTRYVTGTLGLSSYFGTMLEGSLVEKAVDISSGDNQFYGTSFEGVQAGGVAVSGVAGNTFIGCSGLLSYDSPVLADSSGLVTVMGTGGVRFVTNNAGSVALVASQVAGGGAALQTRSATDKFVEADGGALNVYRAGAQTYPGVKLSANYGAGPADVYGGIYLGNGVSAPAAVLGWRGGMDVIASSHPFEAGTFYALGSSDGTLSVTPKWTSGVGSPEGVITASIGSIYSRSDGSTGTSLYVKESNGSGATGWIAK